LDSCGVLSGKKYSAETTEIGRNLEVKQLNEQKGFFADLGELIDRHCVKRGCDTKAQLQASFLRRTLRWFVPNGGTLLLVAVLVLTANVWAKPLTSPAAAPGSSATTVNYQGRLADPTGNPKNGTFGMTFALYDASTGGSLVWGPESHAAVPVSDGLFSVGLGSQTSGGIPTSTWNGDRYLEITVGGETLSPRELIRSVPIAGMALTLPDHTVDDKMLATTGFGTSGVPLRNLVIRDLTTEGDLTDTAEVSEATWDLSPIVGDSAEMVILQVHLNDEVANSHFRAWSIQANSPFVKVPQDDLFNSGILWVKCDSNQTIKYQVYAHGSGNTELSYLSVTVLGWIEPAATP
jgi:hypothetical protein